MSGEVVAAKELVAEAGRMLATAGLIDYLGHVSVRTQAGAVIKPRHSTSIRSASRLGAEHMVEVDHDGRLIGGGEPPPSEVFIHTEIYRARPDVNAVVHTHQRAAVLLGVLERPPLPLLHVAGSYVDDVRLWPHASLVSTPELAADLAVALGDASFCQLQGHGVVVVAATMQEAVVKAFLLEDLAAANLEVLATGLPPRVIPDDELAELRRLRGGIDGRWEYLREQFGGV